MDKTSLQSNCWRNRQYPKALVVLLVLLFTSILYARVEIIEFHDPQKEALYRKMIGELRCLVCQNQNIADSNAELAVDLRNRTRELIIQGKSEVEVTEYMVKRYGEFVIYRPRLNVSTFVLWFSPAILLMFCLWFAMRMIRHKTNPENSFSDSDRAMARELLTKTTRSTLPNSNTFLSQNRGEK